MKLNLHVLSDALSNYKHRLVSDDSIELNLIGMRNFPFPLQNLSPEYIYFIEASELTKLESIQNDICLLILGTIDENLLKITLRQAIIILDAVSPFAIFENILSVFDFYNQWDCTLSHSIISGDLIQKQLDICAEVLENPIALFDTFYILIARSGSLPKNCTGTIWEHILDKGYSTIENIPREYRHIDDECVEKRRPIIIPPLDNPADQRSMCATLMWNNIPFAKIGISNILKEFTIGQLSLLWYIQKVLETAAPINSNLLTTSNDSSFLLNQSLSGESVDPQQLSFFLQKQNWLPDESFYVVAFLNKYDNEFSPNSYQIYLIHIRKSLLFSYITKINNVIVGICRHKPAIESIDTIQNGLSPILKQNDLIAGISMKYTGYEFLHSAMVQSTEAAKLGKNLHSNEIFFSFQTVYIDHIMNALGDKQDIRYYCHPKIQKILKRADPWELELIHTLCIYLLYGRKLSETASHLYIHRNTLLNRLTSIEKLLELSLDDLDEMAIQILYISCKISEVFNKHTNLQAAAAAGGTNSNKNGRASHSRL